MSIVQETIDKYRPYADVFVETGTYLGDTVEMARVAGFSRIFTIEIDDRLAGRAFNRFFDYKHITCFRGDSGKHLHKVLREFNDPAVFWLDGHWSQGITGKGEIEVPLMQELEAIKNHPSDKHTIMIDDIRLLGDKEEVVDWGGLSMDAVEEKLLEINPNYQFTLEDGMQHDDILVAHL